MNEILGNLVLSYFFAF